MRWCFLKKKNTENPTEKFEGQKAEKSRNFVCVRENILMRKENFSFGSHFMCVLLWNVFAENSRVKKKWNRSEEKRWKTFKKNYMTEKSSNLFFLFFLEIIRRKQKRVFYMVSLFSSLFYVDMQKGFRSFRSIKVKENLKDFQWKIPQN